MKDLAGRKHRGDHREGGVPRHSPAMRKWGPPPRRAPGLPVPKMASLGLAGGRLPPHRWLPGPQPAGVGPMRGSGLGHHKSPLGDGPSSSFYPLCSAYSGDRPRRAICSPSQHLTSGRGVCPQNTGPRGQGGGGPLHTPVYSLDNENKNTDLARSSVDKGRCCWVTPGDQNCRCDQSSPDRGLGRGVRPGLSLGSHWRYLGTHADLVPFTNKHL